MDNEEEMDKFLEKYNFPKLDQEEIEIMKTQLQALKLKLLFKNLPKNKSPAPDGFTGEFY